MTEPFPTGRDLKEAAASGSGPTSTVEGRRSRMAGRGADHIAVANMDKPTIAAINGYALGGGCELALCCDIRIASDTLKIGLMEAERGIIPGAGGTQRLSRIVGRAWALEMALTAEPIESETALKIGLVTHVVPGDKLMSEAERIARQIMENAPIAVRYVKEAITKGPGNASGGRNSARDRPLIVDRYDRRRQGRTEGVCRKAPAQLDRAVTPNRRR